MLVDTLAAIAGSALSLEFGYSFQRGAASAVTVSVSVLAVLFTLLLNDRLGSYKPHKLGNVQHRVTCGMLATVLAGLAMAVSLLLTQGAVIVGFATCWTVTVAASLLVASLATGLALEQIVGKAWLAPRVAIVGSEAETRWLADYMRAGDAQSARLVGVYDDGWDEAGRGEDGIANLLAHARRDGIDAIILAMHGSDYSRIASARLLLCGAATDIFLAPKELQQLSDLSLEPGVHPDLLVKILGRPLTQSQAVQKAVFDWIVACLLCVVALPLMGLLAIAVRLDSPGPALFCQVRRGAGNTTFRVFKFRTMYEHLADADATLQTTRGDRRITRVGQFLRKVSLDELPQLFNVLRGEMSLVGPRPHAINTKAGDQLFPDAVAEYPMRYRVKPGITGWAQVNGWRGETKNVEQLRQRVSFDLAYIENWSVAFDVRIMLMTLLREINSKVAF